MRGNQISPADPSPGQEGAKEWLGKRKTDGRPYEPAVDQAPLASAFDLGAARSGSPFFDKFCRDARALLTGAAHAGPGA
ncbi:MAG: hypothetical protein ACRDNZ_04825 [Streptosporangiaceae bacterium]